MLVIDEQSKDASISSSHGAQTRSTVGKDRVGQVNHTWMSGLLISLHQGPGTTGLVTKQEIMQREWDKAARGQLRALGEMEQNQRVRHCRNYTAVM